MIRTTSISGRPCRGKSEIVEKQNGSDAIPDLVRKQYSVSSLYSEITATGKKVFEDYLVVEPKKNRGWLVSLPDLNS
jgi:hypothetical protein